MAKDISTYTSPSELRNLMANAKRIGREDVWTQAFRRLCALEGINENDPLHRDFHEMLRAYEELLTLKNGRTTSASRTLQKLRNKGIVQCLEDWAISSMETTGFNLLVERGLADLTGESLVLKYPTRFSERAISSAKARLAKHGVAVR